MYLLYYIFILIIQVIWLVKILLLVVQLHSFEIHLSAMFLKEKAKYTPDQRWWVLLNDQSLAQLLCFLSFAYCKYFEYGKELRITMNTGLHFKYI